MRDCPSAGRYEQNCRRGVKKGDPHKCYTCGSFLHKQRDCPQYKEEQRKTEEEKQHRFDLHTLSSFCKQRKLQNLDEVRTFLQEKGSFTITYNLSQEHTSKLSISSRITIYCDRYSGYAVTEEWLLYRVLKQESFYNLLENYDVFSSITLSVYPLTLHEIEEKLKELGKMYYKSINERETCIIVEDTPVGNYNPRKENMNIKLANNYKSVLCEAYDRLVKDERGKAQELLEPITTSVQLVYAAMDI